MGHTYQKDKEMVLPESVVKALGSAVKILSEVAPSEVQEKDIKRPFFDKMIHGGNTTTK